MFYIIVTEFETPTETSCKIKGITVKETSILETHLKTENLPFKIMQDYFEVDVSGDKILNILGGPGFYYRVVSQSMAIEITAIGGRTVKVQKLVWTMGRTLIRDYVSAPSDISPQSSRDNQLAEQYKHTD